MQCAGGVILTGVLRSAHPSQGVPYQLDTIVACAIGGVSLTGGFGKVPFALVGAVFIYSIRNILNLLGTHPFIQNLVIGAILIFVVIFNVQRQQAKMTETNS
jgi:ribose/xylose/arabinose/galactoside ABC-type transport system permease subunit